MNGFQKCRIRAGLTQAEAAEALHVVQTTISAWETGHTYPTGKRVAAIARLYGCTIADLYTGHTPPIRRRVRHSKTKE